jgi:RNA polymerase primary sigma factor
MIPVNRTFTDADDTLELDPAATQLLTAAEERKLLRELAEVKQKLQDGLSRVSSRSWPEATEGGMDLAQYVAFTCLDASPQVGARLGAIVRRYTDLRSRLAMANIRLVAHVAKRFRERGISYADLLQEGFCGLLEAIDRFDLSHETKLATYATWWIRQAMQRAVASGAYPVRLSPRHLRQLAQNQDDLDHNQSDKAPSSTEMIRRIHTATRPTISLDASLDADGQFSLLQMMSDPESDHTSDVDTTETITRLMESLRPREREVLALRFGLGGTAKLSLSQVGRALSVSKERVRQIQDRALEKLRKVATELNLSEVLITA